MAVSKNTRPTKKASRKGSPKMQRTVEERIGELAGKYPRKESVLMPALDLLQREGGNQLDRERILKAGRLAGVSPSRAYGVATHYTMFNTKPVGRYHLHVDTCVPGMLAGAYQILECIEKTLGIRPGETTSDGLFTLSTVEDLGSCGTCPVVMVNDVYYENLTVEKTVALLKSLSKGEMPAPDRSATYHSECGILLKNRGNPTARDIVEYRRGGGYEALAKALGMAPASVVDEVKASVLRGRGGAGFPAGVKWGFLPKNDPRPVYLICNADEGEPGTFKDRQIMEHDPHLLVEGIAIAAHAIGAKRAFIYIRGEFRWIAEILEEAIRQATEAGLLAHVQILVHKGAGSYVCGEETALIESIEGKQGCPRRKPPFPAFSGLYNCPTIVNNVETLSCLPYIVAHGSGAFKNIGLPNNFGPKIFGVSGHVNRPGVYEYPLGTPLATILEAAGGVKGTLKAVIVGGLSVPILTAAEAASLKMDFDSCVKAGTMLGSGGIMVINDTTPIPELALRTITFYEHESCGQCTPCREGSYAIAHLLERIVKGKGAVSDIDVILGMCKSIKGLTLCPTGDAFAMPIEAMLTKFRSEFEDRVRG